MAAAGTTAPSTITTTAPSTTTTTATNTTNTTVSSLVPQPPGTSTNAGGQPAANTQTPAATNTNAGGAGVKTQSKAVYIKNDLTDLEQNVLKVTKKMYAQLDTLKESYANNQIIPVRLKRIFQNISDRCYIEINFLRELNFADRRQTSLRLMVEQKLDFLRKDISKLKKIADDITVLNRGNENHVCRDSKNFYTQVGRHHSF